MHIQHVFVTQETLVHDVPADNHSCNVLTKMLVLTDFSAKSKCYPKGSCVSKSYAFRYNAVFHVRLGCHLPVTLSANLPTNPVTPEAVPLT